MPESPLCPYCNSRVPVHGSVPYDTSVQMTCPSCGKDFEYVSGFGVFPLEGRKKSKFTERPTFESLTEDRTQSGRKCISCCSQCCILIIFIYVISSIISIF